MPWGVRPDLGSTPLVCVSSTTKQVGARRSWTEVSTYTDNVESRLCDLDSNTSPSGGHMVSLPGRIGIPK